MYLNLPDTLLLFARLRVIPLMKYYSNGIDLSVVELRLSVDQRRQQDKKIDCMSCMW